MCQSVLIRNAFQTTLELCMEGTLARYKHQSMFVVYRYLPSWIDTKVFARLISVLTSDCQAVHVRYMQTKTWTETHGSDPQAVWICRTFWAFSTVTSWCRGRTPSAQSLNGGLLTIFTVICLTILTHPWKSWSLLTSSSSEVEDRNPECRVPRLTVRSALPLFK